MKHAIAIPSRYDSTRFPGKALHPICGVPMVIRVVRQCLKVLDPMDVYVVTEDDKVANCVTEYGYQVLIDRTKASSGTEKIVQVMDEIDADRITNVQGDEPVIEPASIRKVMMASEEHPDCVLQGFHWSNKSLKNSIRIVADLSGRMLYISRSPIPAGGDVFREYVGVYSFGKHHLKAFGKHNDRLPLETAEDIELLRFLEIGESIRVVEIAPTHHVDYPSDVLVVEHIIERGL